MHRIKILSIFILSFFCTVEATFKLGIENSKHCISMRLPKFASMRFAFVGNQSSVDQEGNRSVDLLHAFLNIACICAPEHGFQGTVPSSHEVHDGVDHTTKIPIKSLYAKDQPRVIDQSVLDAIDGFIFDIQDCGMRHYTYISLLLHIMQSAAEHNKYVIVCDRPNPLGGVIEGPVAQKEWHSFIACAAIPLRHGMTCGELARYFNASVLKKKTALIMVPMSGYHRDVHWGNYKLPPLSPNIQTVRACHNYSFLGLLSEIRPLDVGIGTTHAFEYLMMPSTTELPPHFWRDCATLLKKYGIQATEHHYFSVRKHKEYKGLKVFVPAITKLHAFDALCAFIKFCKKHHVALEPSASCAKACGCMVVDQLANTGSITEKEIAAMHADLQQFYFNAHSAFCYWPFPHIHSPVLR